MAIVRNLATVKTTADITSSATSIPVNRVDVFGTSQTTLDKPFYVTIMPASGDEPANSANSEIVLVTGISGTNLTVTRGQRSTTAKAFNSGAIVTMAIYAEDAVLLGDEGTAVGTPAPWIETSDIKNGAITTDKIADGAVTSDKINWETMKYKTGDVISTGDSSETYGQASFVITAGHITSSQTEIGFNIPISKSAKGLSLSFSSDSKIWIRVPTGGYLINNANISSYKTTVVGYDNFIGVMLKNKDNSAFKATNNIPLAIGLNARINVN